MQCGEPVRIRTAADDDRAARLRAAAPDQLAAQVRATPPLAGERRVATVLFLDVVGSTALAEQLDEESWSAVLTGAFDHIAPIIYRYEGTIARLLGDSLVAFFGAPIAHEDDALRAVRAGLEALRAAERYREICAAQFQIDFRMRGCLNTGPVVVGAIGQDLGYEFSAIGGAVNLATRLKFAAPPGRLVLTDETRRFIAHSYDLRDGGMLDVPGRREPVRIWELLGPRSSPTAGRGLAGLHSPLVGRDQELAVLLEQSDAARAGLGRAVLLVGEPGLGKTRLIQEWQTAAAARADGRRPLRWAVGQCRSYGQNLAYHLVINLVRALLGVNEMSEEAETRRALAHLTAELNSPPTTHTYLAGLLLLRLTADEQALVQRHDPQALRYQYLQALRQVLTTLAQRQPLALVLEDVHWADPASADLLGSLLPLARTHPILLCLATRPEPEAAGWALVAAARSALGSGLTELTLQPLSAESSRLLVGNLLSLENLPEQLRRLILTKAEGNPFFVEEMIRMLIDRAAIVQRNGGWQAGAPVDADDIPDNLEGLLQARIDRLPDEVKETLRVAAVIGRQFPLKVLAHVLGEALP